MPPLSKWIVSNHLYIKFYFFAILFRIYLGILKCSLFHCVWKILKEMKTGHIFFIDINFFQIHFWCTIVNINSHYENEIQLALVQCSEVMDATCCQTKSTSLTNNADDQYHLWISIVRWESTGYCLHIISPRSSPIAEDRQ